MAGTVGFSSMEYGPVLIDQAAGAKGYVKPVASALDPSYREPTQTYSQPQPQQTTAPTGGVPFPDPSNDWQNEQNRIYNEQNQQSSGPSEADVLASRMRGEIEMGYEGYFTKLDEMMGELPNQRTAQEDIVGSQHTQGVADLGTQKSLDLADLGMQRTRTESAQVKSLADIGTSIQNQFSTGQNILGTMGAGDSSAVGRYSYALGKLGSKARGEVRSNTQEMVKEIDNREFKLNTIFSNEKTRLGATRDQAISGIAQWFSEATNTVRQMMAQGQISKGQDLASITQNLLNQAMQAAQTAQTAFLNRQGMLEEWALNNSKSLQEAKEKMAVEANYSPVMPQTPSIQGQMSPPNQLGQNIYRGGGGSSDEEERRVTYQPNYQA